MSEELQGRVGHAFQWLKSRIPGVEYVLKRQRYYNKPRRLNVTHYFNENDGVPGSSHCDVRAWWLTPDRLVAELDPQRLGENNRRSWNRELIIKANITRGETIIEEGTQAERRGVAQERLSE